MICKSIGFVVAEDEECLTISTSTNRDGESYIDPLSIPWSAITAWWEVTVPK